MGVGCQTQEQAVRLGGLERPIPPLQARGQAPLAQAQEQAVRLGGLERPIPPLQARGQAPLAQAQEQAGQALSAQEQEQAGQAPLAQAQEQAGQALSAQEQAVQLGELEQLIPPLQAQEPLTLIQAQAVQLGGTGTTDTTRGTRTTNGTPGGVRALW